MRAEVPHVRMADAVRTAAQIMYASAQRRTQGQTVNTVDSSNMVWFSPLS